MNNEEKFAFGAIVSALAVTVFAVLLRLGILVAVFVLLAKLAFGWFGGF